MNNRFKFRLVIGKDVKTINGTFKSQSIYYCNGFIQTKTKIYLFGNNKRLSFLNSQVKAISQCTGLKDKNGKLIYEGDIVKSDFDFITNTINPLRFNIGNVIYSDYIAGFVIASDINDYSPYKTSFFGKTEALNCMVIGNIYENKELLESEG